MQSTKLSKMAIFILLLVVIVIFTGCAGGGLINNSPVIYSLIADSTNIEVNQDITITCYATDQDGDELSYTWTKTGGTITGSGSAITWTAPDIVGTYAITCTVSDGNGGEDSELLNIVVTESDETKITNTINGFFQALSDLDWDTAKSYCVYGSEIYQVIVAMEQCCDLYGSYECDLSDKSYTVTNINPIIINGEYAEAYVYLTIVWFEDFTYSESWLYLQKIGSNWKIYDTLEVTQYE